MCKAYTAAASECPSPGGRAGPRHEQGMLLVLALLHRAQPDSGRAAAAAPGSSAEPNHPAATRHGGDTALGSRQLRAGPSSAGAAGPGRPLPPHLRTAHAARNGTKHGLCQKSLPSPPGEPCQEARTPAGFDQLLSGALCPARTKMGRDAPPKIPKQGSCSRLPIESRLLGHKQPQVFTFLL